MRFIFPGRIPRDAAGLAALALLIFVCPAKAQDWKLYANQEFSVRYPSSWFLRHHTEKTMDFVNVPGSGLNATGIHAGQTAIDIFLADPAADLEAVITHWIDGDPVLRRKRIFTAKGACENLEQVVTRYDGIPTTQTPVDTNLFCTIGKKTFIFRLTNWIDDKRQEEWQKIARKMVATLRPVS